MQNTDIMKIQDPWQRLMAGIVLRAIQDYFSPPDMKTWLDAYNFLWGRGGEYDNFVPYDIRKVFQLAKEHHARNSSDPAK